MWVYSRSIRRAVDPSGHRHERFGIAPHAVLADVQAFQLFARRHAEADGLFDDPEQAVAEDEYRDERSRHGDGLRTELVKAAGVKQTALTDAVELGQRRRRAEAAGGG